MNGTNRTDKTGDLPATKRSGVPYEDIISLPHQVSKRHAPMPLINRAAQFAPFAAITGYDAEIDETARLTEDKVTLSDHEIAELNRKLQDLSQLLPNRPEVTITYFRPDEKKAGGAYVTISGVVRKIDNLAQCLTMESGEEIPMDCLIGIRMDDPDTGLQE